MDSSLSRPSTQVRRRCIYLHLSLQDAHAYRQIPGLLIPPQAYKLVVVLAQTAKVYIGQTSWSLRQQVKELRRALTTEKISLTSATAEHMLSTIICGIVACFICGIVTCLYASLKLTYNVGTHMMNISTTQWNVWALHSPLKLPKPNKDEGQNTRTRWMQCIMWWAMWKAFIAKASKCAAKLYSKLIVLMLPESIDTLYYIKAEYLCWE